MNPCSRFPIRAGVRPVATWVATCLLLAHAITLPAAAQGLKASGGLAPAGALKATTRAEQPQTVDFIVAVVNSEPVTNQEVRARVARARDQLARNNQGMPPADQLSQQVLEALILEKAQVQLAQELGIKVDNSQVDDAERNIARQNRLTVEQVHAELKRQGVDVAEFRQNLRQQLLIQRLREREVEARVKVSETDIERFVQQKMDNPGADLRINLAQILIPLPENATPQQQSQAMALAQTVAAQARQGEDFAALARTHSAAPERSNGGVMGLRSADRYPVLFLNATRTLSPGGVAGPVRSPAGFHVLKVLDKRIAGLPEPVVPETLARHILLRPSANLTEAQAVAQLTRWREQILAGQADFAAVAKDVSHDSSAKDGGNLGWVGPGVFVPEFEEAMNELRLKEVSTPVVSRFGVHLIQVLERRDVELGPREQREQLRQLVRESKLDEAFQKWLEEVRARAYVEMREPPQ